MFIAKMPITAIPRTMSSVAMRGPLSVTAVMLSPRNYRPRRSHYRRASASRGGSALCRLRLELDIVLKTDLTDQVELLLEHVDMLLLVGEDFGEQVTADIVAHAFGMGDRAAQLVDRLALELEVGAQNLLDILAD